MRKKQFISTEILSFLKLIFTFFSIAVFFRILFLILFKSTAGTGFDTNDILKALYIGFKFDLRAAILFSLPFWLFGYVFKFVNYIFEEKDRKMFIEKKTHPTRIISFLYLIILSLYCFFYTIDIGHYDYLQNRVDASSLIFLKNPLISFGMITQSYPVFLLLTFFIFVLALLYFILNFIVFSRPIFVKGAPLLQTSFKTKFALFFILAALGHAKLSQYPLRWSEAFFSQNNFISSLGLNPILYFFDTLEHDINNYDVELVKKYYPTVSNYLKVDNPDIESLNFDRTITPVEGSFEEAPNVVVIMMESLAAFKISHYGQKIEGTPFIDELIKKSILFENAYVTSTGTARSIFGTLTGLPDLNAFDTASRNPSLIKQYSAINGFDDYQKTYLIGGSANWGNIRGFVSQSIENLSLLEEADLKSGKNDIWGISDYKLFEEAHKILKEKTKNSKQFMFIQTAGYHRPYTIPSERGDFELKTLSESDLSDNGFVSNEEYNSLRFSDYSLKHFFELAEKEDYFKNTLFVIYADHGLSHFNSKSILPGMQYYRLPIMHIPLIFYSPSLKMEPQVISKIAYHVDIMPSTLALAGKTYINKTLGRNLFDPKYDDKRYALTISNFSPPAQLRMLDEEWISTGDPSKIDHLYPYKDITDYKVDQKIKNLEEATYRNELGPGLYHTTRYLYYHSTK